MLFVTNVVTHFQPLSVMCIEYGQNVNKQDISQIEAIFGKISLVYVTQVTVLTKDNDMQ